jgi:hypothetical protein
MYPYNQKMGQKLQTDVSGIIADRGFIAHITVLEPATQSVSAILPATALTSTTQTITSGINNPDVPRSLKIKGNAVGITGNVVITGTNIADEEITETIALNGDAEVLGNKAFKTITSIQLPPETNVGTDTVSVGTANKLGLPYKLKRNTVIAAYRDNIKETTAPTVATSTTVIEDNTVLLSSALNGTNIDIYLIA